MKVLLTLAALLFSTPALSQVPIDPERIAGAATGDFNKDGDIDLALILRPAPSQETRDNGIAIYLADPVYGRMLLKAEVQNVLPSSFIYAGESVAVTALQNGSILATAKNDTPGQRHLEIRLTIAYRNDDFVVAGFGFKQNVPSQLECDINLLTGKGIVNGKPITGVTGAILLTQWSNEIGRAACKP